MMKISVVIPTYKRADLLLICLKHLEYQTLEKEFFEVLVVSDGYDQDTQLSILEYLKTSMLQLRYFHTDGKKGPATARNIGWKNANSDLVAFTDDDCQPDTNWLAAFLEKYKNEQHIAFTGFTQVPLPENPSDFALNTAHLQTAAFITANCACTKDALIQVGGFDERFKAAWREDSDLEFKLKEKNIPIIKVQHARIVHPVRQGAPWNISIKEQRKGVYDALLYKKFPEKFKKEIQTQPPWNYYLILISALLFCISIAINSFLMSIGFLTVFLILIFSLFYKRIKPLKKSWKNIRDMLLTSFIIPFSSIYWRWTGALKFKVLFI